jgi:hypothetical protein
MSRSVASADDADPLVALGGDDVQDTPRWLGCQRDEVRRVQGVVKVLGKRILHGERGFLEADAVLREIARGLGRVPLEVAVHDRCHEHERTSHAADGEEVVRRSSVGPCRSRADPGLGLEIGMPLGVAVGARRQTIVEASALQVLGLGAHSRLVVTPAALLVQQLLDPSQRPAQSLRIGASLPQRQGALELGHHGIRCHESIAACDRPRLQVPSAPSTKFSKLKHLSRLRPPPLPPGCHAERAYGRRASQ